MLDKVLEQWLASNPVAVDPVLRFVEQGSGAPMPTIEQLKRAADNPLVVAYLEQGLQLFQRWVNDPNAPAAVHLLHWRIKTVLQAMKTLQAGQTVQGQAQQT
jgi:hypothetical protein